MLQKDFERIYLHAYLVQGPFRVQTHFYVVRDFGPYEAAECFRLEPANNLIGPSDLSYDFLHLPEWDSWE